MLISINDEYTNIEYKFKKLRPGNYYLALIILLS